MKKPPSLISIVGEEAVFFVDETEVYVKQHDFLPTGHQVINILRGKVELSDMHENKVIARVQWNGIEQNKTEEANGQ